MPEIDILMAAYNGGKYIAEQIDSILAQTFQDFRLIIRDDGSSDNTPAIIEDYARRYPAKIGIAHDDVVCRNATRNFFQLLTYAQADYVMFSDQDDVWLPEKIQVTYDRMKQAEADNPGKPVLVFTGLEVVDAKLRSLNRFMAVNVSAARYDFKNVIYTNIATGMTQMLNRALYKNMGGYVEGIGLHDWWAALYAGAFGVVAHVPQVTSLYRQHSNNVIGGSTHKLLGKRGYLDKFFGIVSHPKQQRKSFYGRCNDIQFFRERFLASLPSDKLQQIDECLELFSSNRLKRVKALIRMRGFWDFKDFIVLTRIKLIIYYLIF